MTSDRTKLQWSYEPGNFFEAPYKSDPHNCELRIENEQVEVTLPTDCDPLADEPVLLRTMESHVADLFTVRQLQTHLKYTLKGPAVYRPFGGTISAAASIKFPTIRAEAHLDCVVRDKDGNIKFDSREHRITSHTAMLDSVVPKLSQSPLLRRSIESYSRAVSDPGDEFIHLYEIRDALMKQFGSRKLAQTARWIAERS